MTSATTELLRGLSARIPDFEDHDPAPIAVPDTESLPPRLVDHISRRIQRIGFVHIRLHGAVSASAVRWLAGCLDLGEPFSPPLYRSGPIRPDAVAQLSATAAGRPTGVLAHPSFSRSGAQRFHTDGTLQQIGEVQSTILLCDKRAEQGGESTLFNATGAFMELLSCDPEAATALMAPDCLLRRATINGSRDEVLGPAFALQDGRLLTRYATTDTDSWHGHDGALPDSLRRGTEFLARAALPGSRYRTSLLLDDGEGLLIGNSIIAHGRNEFTDTAARIRCMYRAIFTRPVGGTRPDYTEADHD